MSDNFTKNQKLLPIASACLKITTFICSVNIDSVFRREEAENNVPVINVDDPEQVKKYTYIATKACVFAPTKHMNLSNKQKSSSSKCSLFLLPSFLFQFVVPMSNIEVFSSAKGKWGVFCGFWLIIFDWRIVRSRCFY